MKVTTAAASPRAAALSRDLDMRAATASAARDSIRGTCENGCPAVPVGLTNRVPSK